MSTKFLDIRIDEEVTLHTDADSKRDFASSIWLRIEYDGKALIRMHFLPLSSEISFDLSKYSFELLESKIWTEDKVLDVGVGLSMTLTSYFLLYAKSSVFSPWSDTIKPWTDFSLLSNQRHNTIMRYFDTLAKTVVWKSLQTLLLEVNRFWQVFTLVNGDVEDLEANVDIVPLWLEKISLSLFSKDKMVENLSEQVSLISEVVVKDKGDVISESEPFLGKINKHSIKKHNDRSESVYSLSDRRHSDRSESVYSELSDRRHSDRSKSVYRSECRSEDKTDCDCHSGDCKETCECQDLDIIEEVTQSACHRIFRDLEYALDEIDSSRVRAIKEVEKVRKNALCQVSNSGEFFDYALDKYKEDVENYIKTETRRIGDWLNAKAEDILYKYKRELGKNLSKGTGKRRR